MVNNHLIMGLVAVSVITLLGSVVVASDGGEDFLSLASLEEEASQAVAEARDSVSGEVYEKDQILHEGVMIETESGNLVCDLSGTPEVGVHVKSGGALVSGGRMQIATDYEECIVYIEEISTMTAEEIIDGYAPNFTTDDLDSVKRSDLEKTDSGGSSEAVYTPYTVQGNYTEWVTRCYFSKFEPGCWDEDANVAKSNNHFRRYQPPDPHVMDRGASWACKAWTGGAPSNWGFSFNEGETTWGEGEIRWAPHHPASATYAWIECGTDQVRAPWELNNLLQLTKVNAQGFEEGDPYCIGSVENEWDYIINLINPAGWNLEDKREKTECLQHPFHEDHPDLTGGWG